MNKSVMILGSLALGSGLLVLHPAPWTARSADTPATANAAATAPSTASTATARPVRYICPMHPQVSSDHPGRCPICGMTLVQHTAGHGVSPAAQVNAFTVPAPVRQRMGLVFETVATQDLQPTLDVSAQVIADERHAVSLSPKVEGWIRRLGVSVVGQPIHKGDVLFELYSPQLQQRQRDFLDLLARRDALNANAAGMGGIADNSAPNLMLASVARERYRIRSQLAAADVPEAVLADLEKTRRIHDVVPVLAEHDGVVTGIGAREGAYVMPAQTVLSYADLSAVWAELSLDPEQLGLLRKPADVLLRSTIDRTLTAHARIDPSFAVVDPVTRVARRRVPLSTGPAGRRGFLPGTLLEARIRMPAHRALTIDSNAVIYTGHGDFVIAAGEQPDDFRQIAVHTGARSGSRVEVVDGLLAGQKVVTNGQFLLSAEASFQSTARGTLADD